MNSENPQNRNLRDIFGKFATGVCAISFYGKNKKPRGITVNCIAPGFIKTNMTDKLNENQTSSILNRIPMNRIGIPIDICSSAIFLASSYSNYITGQTIHVNGGMFMS